MSGLQKERLPGQDQTLFRYASLDVDNSAYELSGLFLLQAQFEHALRLTHDTQELLHSSYNPVTDRWHVEMLQSAGNIVGLQAFRQELWENQRTNLMERLHATESYGEYSIVNGQLHSKEFPEEPFGEIIKRGVLYRAKLGSAEQEREGKLGEVSGWEYINGIMGDQKTAIGTTIFLLSPPGMAPNTAYEGRYADKYTLSIGSEGRKVKRARIAVDWNYDDYKKQASLFKSDFFKGYDGRPIDAWYLSHPILTDKDFAASTQGMSPDKFSAIFNHPTLHRLIKQYERSVFSETANWFDIALSFNAILNCADELKQGEKVHQIAAMDDSAFHDAVYLLGARPVAAVGGGGCPPNRGINLSSVVTIEGNGLAGGSGILSNSVAKFGITGSESCDKISCKKCNWEASEEEVSKIQKGELNACPKCGWKPG
ncbi:MAG: hypothetical protein HYT11_03230 [Candidatus Levybacteria bacterium]|nr:hypothetical protein [Candidatus Levybacteria bacterium]